MLKKPLFKDVENIHGATAKRSENELFPFVRMFTLNPKPQTLNP